MRIHHHTPAEALANLKAELAILPARPTRVLSDDEIANEMRLERRAEDQAAERRGDFEGLAQTWRRSA